MDILKKKKKKHTNISHYLKQIVAQYYPIFSDYFKCDRKSNMNRVMGRGKGNMNRVMGRGKGNMNRLMGRGKGGKGLGC